MNVVAGRPIALRFSAHLSARSTPPLVAGRAGGASLDTPPPPPLQQLLHGRAAATPPRMKKRATAVLLRARRRGLGSSDARAAGASSPHLPLRLQRRWRLRGDAVLRQRAARERHASRPGGAAAPLGQSTWAWVLGNGTDGNPDASRTRPRAPESRTRSRTPTAGA